MNTRPLALCTTLLLLPASAAAAGCASGTVIAGASELTVTEQVAEGAAVYEANCAKCHGANGEGTGKAPALVGPTALPLEPRPGAKVRTMAFHTAADVLGFIEAKMPADRPGSLREDQYAAVLAFALHANGVDFHGVPLSEATAPSIVLH